MTDRECDVLVIGAGICGLACAWRLTRDGHAVEAIDAAARAGGVIGSELRDGFLCETGPTSVLEGNVQLRELVTELGIADERRYVSATAKKRFVVRGGKLIALPLSPMGLFRTPLFSRQAKLRVLSEPLVPRATSSDESVTTFVTRRLGREFFDYAIEPFVAGVFAGDADALSVRAAFPRLHALEERYGSLIRGQLRGGRDRAKERGFTGTPKSFSFERGMQTLVDALSHAGPRVQTGVRAERIVRAGAEFIVDVRGADGPARLRARKVVLATPATDAAALVESHAPAAAAALRAIAYAPVASVSLGYARADVAHALDGFGFLVPRREPHRILGCLFSSTMFEGRAPEGHVLLTVFVGGSREPALVQLGDEALASIAHEELAPLLGIRAAPRFRAVTRWPSAIPQYTLGHFDRVAQIEEAERVLPGLFLVGSYRGGVSVGDCLQSGLRTAEAAAPRR